uniref:Uncharacterized protein n=1 Tax=Glossina pallidipes TaxID=7398 RepID=A0A1B0A6B2_GLOPL
MKVSQWLVIGDFVSSSWEIADLRATLLLSEDLSPLIAFERLPLDLLIAVFERFDGGCMALLLSIEISSSKVLMIGLGGGGVEYTKIRNREITAVMHSKALRFTIDIRTSLSHNKMLFSEDIYNYVEPFVKHFNGISTEFFNSNAQTSTDTNQYLIKDDNFNISIILRLDLIASAADAAEPPAESELEPLLIS